MILGGIAIVLHGLHRSTKDVDIWLDPGRDAGVWSSILLTLLKTEGLTPARVNGKTNKFYAINPEDIEEAIEADRFIRILGTDRPIDVFRIPNNLGISDFEEVWQNGQPLEDGTRIPDEIDLILTKLNTGRPHDESDVRYLESKLEIRYREKLRTCSPQEAMELLRRFVTPDISAFAAQHAEDPQVRQLAKSYLQDMSLEGNPYATELLEQLQRNHKGPELGR